MKNADKSAFAYGFAIEPNKGYMNVDGLTKREYFAAMAMQCFIELDIKDGLTFDEVSERCVMQADALLIALNKK
jgi:hypothetical protein